MGADGRMPTWLEGGPRPLATRLAVGRIPRISEFLPLFFFCPSICWGLQVYVHRSSASRSTIVGLVPQRKEAHFSGPLENPSDFFNAVVSLCSCSNRAAARSLLPVDRQCCSTSGPAASSSSSSSSSSSRVYRHRLLKACCCWTRSGQQQALEALQQQQQDRLLHLLLLQLL